MIEDFVTVWMSVRLGSSAWIETTAMVAFWIRIIRMLYHRKINKREMMIGGEPRMKILMKEEIQSRTTSLPR